MRKYRRIKYSVQPNNRQRRSWNGQDRKLRKTQPGFVKKHVRRDGRQVMRMASSAVLLRHWKRAGRSGRKSFPNWKPV